MAKRNETSKETMTLNNHVTELARSEAPSELLRELVAHLRQNRTQLREEWVVRISETRLLTAMTKEEIFAEATSIYDSYVEALETEAFDDRRAAGEVARGFDFDIVLAGRSTKCGIERYAHAHWIGERNALLPGLLEECFRGGGVAADGKLRDGVF